MSFKSYVINPYEHSHENTFFRTLSTILKEKLSESDLLSVLIGNLSCNGHQIDALFISRGKIIVIDFKNYGGELTFSENNPWKINTGNDFVFVKGGGGIRNPFQQVSAYRYSLIQFLGNKQEEILEPNHSNFNFGHINSLIIFHQKVSYDVNQIPQTIQKYFGIADYENCINALIDRNSNQLNLSNTEIERILNCLDIKEENLFDEEKEIEAFKDKEIPFASERLEMVKQLLSNANPTSEAEKLLLYYQTLVSLERKKEPSIKGDYIYPINWQNIDDTIFVNIENSPDFHVIVQQNIHQQFPKNIFIGINISINNQKIILLHTVIESRSILNFSNLEIPISDFSLHTRPLEERNYPNELIDELIVSINQMNTLADKINVLQSYLGDNVELISSLSLALSEESPFTSQLLSELKKISQNQISGNNLESFLFKKPFLNKSKEIFQDEDFIQITSLNKNQKEAVKIAFNQPISVITGPPGTGKTQVVLNILANALMLNKKVLLASKNNQAIDNVKERISSIMNEPDFFLRFGSKTEINDRTKPIIESFLRRTHNQLIEDNSLQLEKLKTKKREKFNEIKALSEKIELKKLIEQKLPVIKKKLDDLIIENQTWIKKQNLDKINTSIKINELHLTISKFTVNKNEVQSKYSGLSKIFFNFTYKKKLALLLVNKSETLPHFIKENLKIQGDYPILEKQTSGENIIASYNKIIDSLNQVRNSLEQNEKYRVEIENTQQTIKSNIEELEHLKNTENKILTKIEALNKENDELGIPLFNALIQQKLVKGNEIQINRYKNYIPDNIPWMNQEIPDFELSTLEFLKTFNISAITSLSVKSAFPLSNEIFDIVVIDEASQCDITSAIPLILRAKQLVVIGDPMQLKHITKVQSYEEKFILKTLEINQNLDYVNKSLYDYCYDLSIESKSQSVFLKEHFRCHPQIIEYSNKAFYGPKMGQELSIKTTNEQFTIEPKGIIWKNVNGSHTQNQNTNYSEIEKTVQLAIELAEEQPNITIGITTPFSDQANAIKNAIPERYLKNIKADTVHRFQGDEKDIMILSLVVTSNSPNHKAGWINNMVPYLINVAVTRAKNTLYIIGNANYCKQLPANSPIGQLVKYSNELGRIEM